LAFLALVQQEGYDLALQMHGAGTITNPLTTLLGARRTAGFYLPGQYCPDPERYLPYPRQIPEVWRHLRLLQFLGVPLQGEHLEFPLHEADRAALRAVEGADDLPARSYICIHAGARAEARRWPPDRFAVVADALAAAGWRVVLTGSRDEQPLTQAVAAAMKAPVLDLAGRTSLGALAALLYGSRLLVCNDTGVSHLAAALRVPSVVVFHLLSECEGWPPLDHVLHRVVAGVAGVVPEAVIEQAEALLRVTSRGNAGRRKCRALISSRT
jgi:ADP-heptose:LPS heptosyltransferase